MLKGGVPPERRVKAKGGLPVPTVQPGVAELSKSKIVLPGDSGGGGGEGGGEGGGSEGSGDGGESGGMPEGASGMRAGMRVWLGGGEGSAPSRCRCPRRPPAWPGPGWSAPLLGRRVSKASRSRT